MDELQYDLERDAVRVVLTDGGGRVLLFHVLTPDQAPDGWWELPGGGIDPGESYLEAAVREIRAGPGSTSTRARSARRRGGADTTWLSRGKRRLQHEVVVRARIASDQPVIEDGGRTPQEVEDFWPRSGGGGCPRSPGAGRGSTRACLPKLLPAFLAGETIEEPFERWN